MVGQRSGADDVAKKISETHDAAIAELAELRTVADEIARILKEVESKK
jgi:hypothetical protein